MNDVKPIDPTWMWGSSGALQLVFPGSTSNIATAQLAQVTLPEPAVCSLFLEAFLSTSVPTLSLAEFTVNLFQGLGRVTIPRRVTFAGQPSSLAPLQWTLPFIPLHTLNIDVECTGQGTGPGEIDVQVYLVVAPITRIPQQQQKLNFGMALPGEADALDDELREDLEDESPTTQEVMSQEADHRVHGDASEDDDEDDDTPQQVPAWMLELVDKLSQRLGRVPTRKELRGAVRRMRERAARRGR